MNKENLKNILQTLKELRTELGLKFSDDILMDCATRIFNSPMNTDGRKPFNKVLGGSSEVESPMPIHTPNTNKATDKQIELLYKLDANFNEEEITFDEARVLIDELLSKLNKTKKKFKDY